MLVAEKQRVADKRVAARDHPGQQRIVLVGEIGPEDRRERAAQPEVLEDDDLAARHGAAGRELDRHPEAARRPARDEPGAA